MSAMISRSRKVIVLVQLCGLGGYIVSLLPMRTEDKDHAGQILITVSVIDRSRVGDNPFRLIRGA